MSSRSATRLRGMSPHCGSARKARGCGVLWAGPVLFRAGRGLAAPGETGAEPRRAAPAHAGTALYGICVDLVQGLCEYPLLDCTEITSADTQLGGTAGVSQATRWFSWAKTTSWTRSRRPSLASTELTWVLTVDSLRNSLLAISALLRPRAAARNT